MDFKAHFISKWPEEAVGYLKAGEFYPLENIAEDRHHSFKVDPSFLIEEPDCLLHSHATGYEIQQGDPREPSAEDLKFQIATGIEWGICVTDGEVCEEPLYWGNPTRRPELLGREFILNLQDCFALVQDWFYQERGVVLPNFAREAHWAADGEDYLMQNYEAWGFSKVELDDLQPGDVLFYQIRQPVPHHLGIYLGENKVLSHFAQRLSCVEDFGKWGRYVVFAARYTK